MLKELQILLLQLGRLALVFYNHSTSIILSVEEGPCKSADLSGGLQEPNGSGP